MSVQVAIGVFEGKVIATWHEPVSQIEFDAKNAYSVGIALSRAAMEAHRGTRQPEKDLEFLAGELAETKITVTDNQRSAMIAKVATMVRTFYPGTDAVKSEYYASHFVDGVLQETAK